MFAASVLFYNFNSGVVYACFTGFVLEAPAGLVRVRADVREGRVELLTFENVPSFATHLGATVDITAERRRKTARDPGNALPAWQSGEMAADRRNGTGRGAHAIRRVHTLQGLERVIQSFLHGSLRRLV